MIMIVIKVLNPDYTIKVLLEMIRVEHIAAYLTALFGGLIVSDIAKKINCKND